MLYAAALDAQPALSLIEKAVSLKHPVPNLKVEDAKRRLATRDSAQLVFFDVRAPDEYATSRLANARRVDPEMPAAAFADAFAADIAGKDVVFYCSVGYRSSIFLRRVEEVAAAAGARSLANLRGGIFRWYNKGYPVVDDEGATDEIHPYDRFWGRLVKRRDGQ